MLSHDAGSRRQLSRSKFGASSDTKADVLDLLTVGFFEVIEDFVHALAGHKHEEARGD